MTRTVGVEEELILVDIKSGLPLAVSPAVLAKATTALGGDPLATVGVVPRGAIEGEFQQQQLEIHTSPVTNLADLDAELRQWRGVAIDLAREVGRASPPSACRPCRSSRVPCRHRATPGSMSCSGSPRATT